jgi:uncharacterized protein (UPF0371 family)
MRQRAPRGAKAARAEPWEKRKALPAKVDKGRGVHPCGVGCPSGKGKAGGAIVSGAAVQLKDGRVVTGKNSDEMHAAAAMMMNAVKTLAGIPSQIPLISPAIIRAIAHMKQDILKVGYTSLNLDEALIGLAISSTTNPAAQIAMEKLDELRGCEVHMTHMVTPGDEAGLRRIGCRYTSDPIYATNTLFTGRC